MKEKTFALYKGDNFLDIGTAKEIASRKNVKPEFIRYLSTPANLRRIESRKNKNRISNAMISIKIEDDEEVK